MLVIMQYAYKLQYRHKYGYDKLDISIHYTVHSLEHTSGLYL